MLDGVLKISEPHNSTLATVHLCRDTIEVKMNMREHDRNRTQHLDLFIDYYENRDEEGFIITRKLETVGFIFDLRDHRQTQATARRLKQARFPMVKELSEFDFTAAPRVNKKQILDLSMCGFIEKRSNVVFTGPPGVGKTHLSIALDREACKRGYAVRFFTAAELVHTYLEARQEKTVLKPESQIRNSDLVLVDELGYVPFDRMGAEHLFGFFSQCYEQTSLIVTTNLPFVEWPQVFAGDERLTGALLDRLTHHVLVVEILSDSYRLNASLKRKKKSG